MYQYHNYKIYDTINQNIDIAVKSVFIVSVLLVIGNIHW